MTLCHQLTMVLHLLPTSLSEFEAEVGYLYDKPTTTQVVHLLMHYRTLFYYFHLADYEATQGEVTG